jgi:hypothetical protein
LQTDTAVYFCIHNNFNIYQLYPACFQATVFDGKFINGQLQDKQLKRLAMDQGFWFEWTAFHPETEVFSIK